MSEVFVMCLCACMHACMYAQLRLTSQIDDCDPANIDDEQAIDEFEGVDSSMNSDVTSLHEFSFVQVCQQFWPQRLIKRSWPNYRGNSLRSKKNDYVTLRFTRRLKEHAAQWLTG